MATAKPRKQLPRAAESRDRAGSVFLNIPYDAPFENLLLAYIAGISAFGFTPRATLEIPFGQRRLDRILNLIGQCKYSIHDLSRVQLDRKLPRTPRFNMPFELGLTVALERAAHPDHSWVVCETVRRRINKSLKIGQRIRRNRPPTGRRRDVPDLPRSSGATGEHSAQGRSTRPFQHESVQRTRRDRTQRSR